MQSTHTSLGILATVGGLCLANVALAQSQATTLKVSPSGTGHMLIVPYYTAQGGNTTLLHIVNADKVNGKAVKVRFRGASNADNVFDVTLLLSPGDVWTAEVSQNPGTGYARLRTQDNTCTLPTQVNADFPGTRLNPASSRPNETREGYVEILTMANIPPTSPAWNAIKHTYGVTPAPCSGAVSVPVALRPFLTEAGIAGLGLGNPTTGLLANWSIVNMADGTSWSGAATAIVAVDANGRPGYGNTVAYPQTTGTPSQISSGTPIAQLTADPLLASGIVPIQLYDLPDLSTPYVTGLASAQQAALLSAALAKASLSNEYLTNDATLSHTDWVFTMPTRRYGVAINHATGLPVFTTPSSSHFSASNTTVLGAGGDRKICVTGISRGFRDQSEQVEPVVSPVPVVPLCGGVSVWSINAGSGLAPSAAAAQVTRQNLELGYEDGWGEIGTPGLYRVPGLPGLGSYGLPLLGMALSKNTNPHTGGSYGRNWTHRSTEPTVNVPPGF